MRLERIIYCPECNSERVEVVQLDRPEPERISIDEMVRMWGQPVVTYTDFRIHSWRARCLDCGYQKEWRG